MSENDSPEPQPEQPFDPYRYGKPDHPIPPEYAPPGYVPDPPAEPYPAHPYYGQSPYASIPPPHAAPGQYGQYGAPGPYGPPGQYPYYPPPRGGNGMAVASMVLGIISIIASILFFFDAVFIALAVIFGLISLNGKRPGRSMAIAGLACAAVGALLAILVTVAVNDRVQKCGGWSHLGDPGFSDCIDRN